jgi:PQQ-dependent catabolism-associated CXXCW motif protein
MTDRTLLVWLSVLFWLAGAPAWADATRRLPEGVDPATGYRMGNYRAPTPGWVPGGTVFDTDRVKAAVSTSDRKLIDVIAMGVLPDPNGKGWLVSKPRETIPGSIWLPGVGTGSIEPDMERYFRQNLERLARGDKAAPLLFFCMADCWQSWNAAKRAAELGYTEVAWYPLGTDGWKEAGGALVNASPVDRDVAE